jgi:hypothetical protein
MKKKPQIPILKVRKNATLREIYARDREEFTAEDLQRYTEVEEGIPAEQVLAELEAVHQRITRKKPKTKQKK